MVPELFKKLVNLSYALAIGGITVIILINASSANSESAVISLISLFANCKEFNGFINSH